MERLVSVLSVRNIHKSFGELTVLDGVDLDVAEGEVVCLMGPSGSGKSTLLRCINSLEEYEQGTVRLDGELVGRRVFGASLRRVSGRTLARQRSSIGIVFQEFHLFPHLSALENVMLAPRIVKGLSRVDAETVGRRLLSRVGLSEKADVRPGRLSGGQKQRVAIARALAMDPRLILFDEPTSALDPELVGEVLSVMRELADGGMTMLVVTHEVGFTQRVADRVVIFHGGEIIESGPPADVLGRPSREETRRFLGQLADESEPVVH